jgi:hypothetical protein
VVADDLAVVDDYPRCAFKTAHQRLRYGFLKFIHTVSPVRTSCLPLT